MAPHYFLGLAVCNVFGRISYMTFSMAGRISVMGLSSSAVFNLVFKLCIIQPMFGRISCVAP